jgi:TonB family protein
VSANRHVRAGPRLLRRRTALPRHTVAFQLCARVGHVLFGAVLDRVLDLLPEPERRPSPPMSLVVLQPPAEEDEEELEDEDPLDVDGQIVEIAPPEVQERPDDAEYLAEYDQTVPEETRSERFKVNPEVLARTYSKEEKMEMEDLLDLQVDKPSTGAQTGNDRFDPDRDGSLAAVHSKYMLTNKEGTQDPVPSSHMSSSMAGAPQNDLLDEKRGDAVALNTKEFLYASYLNRIRRLVNFFWQQNLDNLPRSASARLVKPQYSTTVNVILDANGALEYIEITADSGSSELDEALVRAYRLAGPFPNPPAGLIEKDGRVYLPDMSWTVRVGTASMRYEGIDPRAGVQFPGILKSPR